MLDLVYIPHTLFVMVNYKIVENLQKKKYYSQNCNKGSNVVSIMQ